MTQIDSRCPRCGSQVRGRADWCTLCYADLRPALPEPAVVTPVEAVTTAPAGTGKHARREASSAATPSVALASAGDPTAAATAALQSADAMLAVLAAESGPLLGNLGGWGGRLDNKGAQLGVMAGGLLVVALLLLGFMSLAGLLV